MSTPQAPAPAQPSSGTKFRRPSGASKTKPAAKPDTLQQPTTSTTTAESSSTTTEGIAILTTGPIEEQPLLVARRRQKDDTRRMRACLFGTAFVAAVLLLLVGGGLLALPATYSCAPEGGKGNYYVVHVAYPNFTAVTPPVVCAIVQNSFNVTAASRVFLTKNSERPTVQIGSQTITEFTMADCEELDVRWRKVMACRTLLFNASFPDDPSLQPTNQVLVVSNPPPYKPWLVKLPEANCSVERKLLTVVPAPDIQDVDPPFVCTSEATDVTLKGIYFLQSQRTGQTTVNAPEMTMCGTEMQKPLLSDCTDLPEASGYDFVRKCSTMQFTATTDSCAYAEFGKIGLTNPAPAVCSCVTGTASSLYVAAPPEIAKSEPKVVCSATPGAVVRVFATGNDFIGVDWHEPTIKVHGTDASIWTDDCLYSYVGTHSLMRCTQGVVVVPTIDVDVPTAADIEVASSLSTCSATKKEAFVLEPRPLLTAVAPSSVCAAGDPQQIVATGRFIAENGTDVTATIGETTSPMTSLEDCTESVVGGVVFKSCNSLRITVPADSAAGKQAVSVATLCSASIENAISIVPTPEATTASLTQICYAADTKVSITGQNFLLEDATLPAVTLGGVAVSALALGACTPDTGSFVLCSEMNFSVPTGSVPLGAASLQISNGVAGCKSSAFAFEVVPAPTITSFTTQFCENQGADVKIVGTNFAVASATVSLQNTVSGTLYPASSIVSITANTIVARFAANQIPAGSYSILVKNSPVIECQVSTGTTTLTVHANTLGIWTAQPSVIMADETTSVTLYATNFNAVPDSLKFIGNNGAVNLTYTSTQISHETDKYNKLTVVVPAGSVSAATKFSVSALAPNTCRITVDSILSIVSATTFTISSVSPVVSHANSSTIVTITSSSSVFSATELPNVFLSGHISTKAADASDTAHLLGSVSFVSATTITAVVPKDVFAAGLYDLTVTSSTGQIAATLLRALTIASAPAPTLDSVSPRAITTASPVLNITGTNFQTSSTYTLVLDCEEFDYTDNTINSVTPTLIRATLNLDDINGGTVCTIILTDTTLEYVVRYYGLAVMEITRKLDGWHHYELPASRCGAAAASATIGAQDVVYMLGGDIDAACKGLSPTTSVIYSKLDAFGWPSTWATTTSLPQARAHTSVERIGSFLYLVGGFDGASAVNSIFRAQILQLSEAPVLTGSLEVTADTHTLAAGVYYYAVSALYKSTDTSNPSGETLPSNVISVQVPSLAAHATVSLSWDAVYEASGYNVYRTASPGMQPNQLVLLAEVTATSYTDTGAATPGTAVPEVVGALGNWVTISNPMTVARYGHATTTTESSGAVFYLFAFDGLSGAGTASSYESMMITVNAPMVAHGRETHIVSAWRVGSRTMTHSPFRHAVSLDKAIMGSSYSAWLEAVIIGNGQGSNVHSMNYLDNSDNFVLQHWTEANETIVHYFGSCMFASNGVLYSLGGTNVTDFSPVTGAAGYMTLNTVAPPTGNPLTTYKTNRGSPLVPTAFAGCAHARGNFYLLGGKALSSGISNIAQFVAG